MFIINVMLYLFIFKPLLATFACVYVAVRHVIINTKGDRWHVLIYHEFVSVM